MGPIFKHHCFISYRSDDYEAANQITQLSQKEGLRLWLDMDSGENNLILKTLREEHDPRGAKIPSDSIKEVLSEAINSSMITVVVTSKNTLSSFWVREEIQLSIATRTPLFFWHIIGEEHSEKIPIRRTSMNQSDIRADHWMENLSKYYNEEHLPTASSRIFMKELESKRPCLNLVGHQIRPINELDSVFHELNSLIELSELALHNSKAVTMENLLIFWPEYLTLKNKEMELKSKIESLYGKKIVASRVPTNTYFSLKKPFVKSRILHYERILEDEEFRISEFAKTGKKNYN